MIKKILPLALCGLLAGCAAIKEFQPLQSGLQTFFVRSLVVAKPTGGTDKHAFLIWGSTGDKLSTMKRGPKGGPATADVSGLNVNGSFHDDTTVSEGSSYRYDATFGSKTLTREIKVMAVSEAGLVAAKSPSLTAGTGANAEARPNFSWEVDDINGKPSGFLISVVEASDLNSSAGREPVYTAFLDAASHSTGVAYGTKSDMAGMTEELLKVLGEADSRYAKKDADVPSLKAGANYVWLIAPIAVDKEKASFAIGDQSAALFNVAP